MRPILIAFFCALAGCQTLPDKPPDLLTSVRTVEIKVPIPIPCVAANDKPAIPATNMRPGNDPVRLYEQMRADLDDWRDYGIKADAIMNSCINAAIAPPKGP